MTASFRDKTILITGGTGTIGSEVLRQVLEQQPRVVRIFSRDETKHAQQRLELPRSAPVRHLIGDVRDLERLRCALDGVDVVFHAAALKHVPACEYNPFEAAQTNVLGTQNLIQGCREAGVGRFVYISTDKAVRPVNTMGATKLLAENLVRASQEWNPSMTLSVVRFGNVLGSRGSVLPLLARQMEERRRVDLTSSRMTRFMMTIGDAVHLVLQAANTSQGGELFVLKMPALLVRDLVEVFVDEYSARRGWQPGSVEICEAGIRAGEKMHEDLITPEECSRLEERDGMFVVRPLWQGQGQDVPVETPDACHSDRCRKLERSEIAALLERSGIFERLQVPLSAAERAEQLES